MNDKAQRSPERAPDDEDDDDLKTAASTEHDEEDDEAAAGDDDPGGVADDEQALVEERARRLGWVPEDQWRGRPGAWVPASQFLDRVLANRPIFEERLEQMERRHATETADLKQKIEESGEVLLEISERFKRADQAGYERARRQLEEEMESAVAEADTERFREAKGRLDSLKPPEPAKQPAKDDETPAKAPAAKPNPIVTEWVADNPWFNKDMVCHQMAEALHVELLRTHPHLSLRDNLDEVTRQVKERFPERFDNPRRRAPSTTTPPSGDRLARNGKRGRSYDDLPDDAKKACDKYCRTIPGYTREQYLAIYEWD